MYSILIYFTYLILYVSYNIYIGRTGGEHHHFGAVPDWISRRIFGSRRHVEPERGEEPGRGNRCFRRVRRVFHLHHRDTDIVRVRVQSPEEDVSGECTLTEIPYIYIYM